MRTFQAVPAVRERVPIWVGLYGCQGSGKTYSALRLATGIASETKGPIYVIDTEARRALHYADGFTYRHIDLSAPFGSADYLAAIQYCLKDAQATAATRNAPGSGAGNGRRDGAAAAPSTVIVIDSLSHEHEGPGGYLDYHTAELARLAGDDPGKRARVNFLAYARPAAARQAFINSAAQTSAHVICCFRAKEKTALVKDAKGRQEFVSLGWQPIGAPDLAYSMALMVLLKPRSNGVPTWHSENEAELAMMKLPEQFKPMFAKPRPLDEEMGRELAIWAAGAKKPDPTMADKELQRAVNEDSMVAAGELLDNAAAAGTASLKLAWEHLPGSVKALLKTRLDEHFKPIAEKMDKALAQEQGNAEQTTAEG